MPRKRTRDEPRELRRCSFCSKSEADVKRLFSGEAPDSNICNECLEVCVEIIADNVEINSRQEHPSHPVAGYESCSFCLKKADQVKHLVGGPTDAICDECVLRWSAT